MNPPPNDFSANIERFSGFAGLYDRYRPSPPPILSVILTRLANTSFPEVVVDLGCGTGLSTRYWADQAGQVVGIEPSADMRHQAGAQTTAANISYREGFSHQTGLPGDFARIVTCSQALHWMEPESTFREVTRILQPGGVFAAFDYDWPPATGSWEADAAYEALMDNVRSIEKQRGSRQALQHWDKSGHLGRMRASGRFRYTREIAVHAIDTGNAERLVGLALSQGGLMSLLKSGLSETELGLDRLREIAGRTLGDQPADWYWTSRVRIGIL